MKVRNNNSHNMSVYARHTGSGVPKRISIPAGSLLELDDAEWREHFAAAAAPAIEAGGLEIVKAPVPTAEEAAKAEAAAVAAAQKVLDDKAAADKAATKPAK